MTILALGLSHAASNQRELQAHSPGSCSVCDFFPVCRLEGCYFPCCLAQAGASGNTILFINESASVAKAVADL